MIVIRKGPEGSGDVMARLGIIDWGDCGRIGWLSQKGPMRVITVEHRPVH